MYSTARRHPEGIPTYSISTLIQLWWLLVLPALFHHLFFCFFLLLRVLLAPPLLRSGYLDIAVQRSMVDTVQYRTVQYKGKELKSSRILLFLLILRPLFAVPGDRGVLNLLANQASPLVTAVAKGQTGDRT